MSEQSELIDNSVNIIQSALVSAEAAADGLTDEVVKADAKATLADLHARANELFTGFKDRHPELTETVALRSGPVEK